MTVVIRKATMRDVKLLIPLAKGLMDHNRQLAKNDKTRQELLKLVDNIESLWRRWVQKWIKSPNGLVLIAEINGKIAGYSLNFVKENVRVYRIRKIGYISDLYIKSGYRGKGIASRLKTEAWKWFRKKELKYASIAVHAENKKAHRIYKDWGFVDYHIEMRRKL